MIHATCSECEVRFSTEFASVSRSCPRCGAPLALADTAAEVMGQPLYVEPPALPSISPPRRDGR